MSYIIYSIKDSSILEIAKPGRLYGKRSYATKAAAKAAITRQVTKGKIERADYEVAERTYYLDNIEQKEVVTFINPHDGSVSKVEQSVNTPLCCDPSSETYWSM